MDRLIGVFGLLLILLIACAASTDRRLILWRTVGWGFVLQILFALTVFKFGFGQEALAWTAAGVKGLIGYADRGGEFLFGWLVTDPDPGRFVFAFRVLPIVIFISSLFTCLYYLGIMQFVVLAMARIMARFMRVSGAESLATAANVFMGQTEAPIIVAPYISRMTRSELMALMTGGMATVSGSILGGYIALGIRTEYLIAASVMAAPAALMMAKIVVPESGSPATAGRLKLEVGRTDANLIEAAARGAGKGLELALNIAAMLIAFISMIYLVNAGLGLVGRLLGLEAILGEPLRLEQILGYLLAPATCVMGVPVEDATRVGRLIGLKVVLNEFLAYAELVEIRSELSPKAELISTFALCGFANFASIGIQLGGIGALAPGRRADLARLGLRALLAGTLASLFTATLVGVLA